MKERNFWSFIIGAPFVVINLAFSQGPAPPPEDAPEALFQSSAALLSDAPSSISRRQQSLSIVGPALPMPNWVAEGPAPIFFGQVENIVPQDSVAGAIHTVLAHPTDPNTLYVGTVNGGIWKTHTALDFFPDWIPMTDQLPSLSIGAMAFDRSDPNKILAGIGRFSSFGLAGGELVGLLLSEDAGTTWQVISAPELFLQNISGVYLDGDRILVSANFFFSPGGLFRSTDHGRSFEKLDGKPGTGLPPGSVFDLAPDPTNPDRFYLSMASTGIFRSDDGGATWVNVSVNDPGNLHAKITDPRNNNAEMSVASNGRLYVGVLLSGQPHYIGFTDDHGATWTAMDLPATREFDGDVEGLNPRAKPGSQGAIHFSILADPGEPTTVYMGGDRQDVPFPNFIGAVDFTGRLFRGDTTVAPTGTVPSPQWEHLTHRNDISAIPGGGTANSSAPHADSRELAFNANGDLIETDDGGIFRRTSPRDNQGDWFSAVGDLQITEFHDIAYDSVSKAIIGGSQDNGTPEQPRPGSLVWFQVSGADGGDVLVDDRSTPGFSHRYSSFQVLGGFRRIVYDAFGFIQAVIFPGLRVLDAGGRSLFEIDPFIQFAQPLELNAIDPARGILGTVRLYESLDRFETLRTLSDAGDFIRGMAYGGSLRGVPNPDVIYFGAGTELFFRERLGDPVSKLEHYPGIFPRDLVRDIVLDPDDWRTAYVLGLRSVQVTKDAGLTWSDVTGNLLPPGLVLHSLETIVFIPGDIDAIVVGGTSGLSRMRVDDPGNWQPFGNGLPNAPVFDMEYDGTDDILVVGTMGRGAWSLSPASQVLGDLNFDRCIDRQDMELLVAAISAKNVDPVTMDLNKDGVVNIADARTLVGKFSNPGGAPCAR